MTSKPIASALCFALCPWLVALHAGQFEEPARAATIASFTFTL